MIVLNTRIVDRSCVRGLGRGGLGRLQKQSLKAAAEDWHARTLPRHFTPGNMARYQIRKRSAFYLGIIKPRAGVGQGRFVDLVLKGRSKRFLQTFVTITGTKDRQTVRMKPPGYFTNPFVGSWTDPKSGRTRRITRQPDKPAETTRTNSEDRDRLRRVCETRLAALVRQAKADRTVTITGN